MYQLIEGVSTNRDECNGVEWRLAPFEVQGYLIGRRDSQYHWKQWINTDFDSDFICTTNNVDFVELVKHSFGKTPIPVNNIPQSKNVYPFSMEGKWEANSKLKNSFIGQITNLAQIAVSHISELKMNKDKYLNAEARIKELEDIVIVLVVLSNVAIDNAKRVYDCDLGSYLRSCKKNDCWIKENSKIVKPSFFKGVSKNKADKIVKLDCNVDMLTVETYKSYAQNKEIIELLDKPNGKYNDKQEKDILELLEEADKNIRKERMRTSKEESDTYKIVDDIKLDLERNIQKKKIKEATFIHIIRLCFADKKWSKYRALCLSAMFKYKSKDGDLLLQKCLKK